ncbi:MAG: hypothetical protein AB7O59_15605 [Pirellulales bacterium]
MTTGDSRPQPALGFLTILEHELHGLVGGYLILNTSGRPLEFHCTAPLKPNRAQQILFGPTLDSYLYGEQIGQTLVARASVELLAVCTDVERALCVREFVATPLALVLGGEKTGDNLRIDNTTTADSSLPSPLTGEGPGVRVPNHSSGAWRVDAAHRTGPHLAEFTIGRNRLAVPAHRHDDRERLTAQLESVAALDLCEPFERIRQAVEEAHKSRL